MTSSTRTVVESVAVKACEILAAYRAGQYLSVGSNVSPSNEPRLAMMLLAVTSFPLSFVKFLTNLGCCLEMG